VRHDRTRPFLKIQDGCDARCTYCIIPSVRGAARSAPPERVLAAARRLIDQGYFEIVLAGVHLGTYGEHLEPRSNLTELVERLLALPGLGRLRLSCIEPMAFPMALAELAAAEPRLAPHFHLPLQAGSNPVLKRMARPYRGDEFVAVLRELRERVPRACLASDVIVGFPGETEANFQETLRVVTESHLDYVHVFSYSDRPGVASTRLPEKQSAAVIKDRARRLIECSQLRFFAFLNRQVGSELVALSLESPGSTVSTSALTDNYAPLILDRPFAPNTELSVRVTGRSHEALLGQVQSVIRPAPDRAARARS
jgi:threonylcarbamoyladenosine tRNA methylthiotransferase MtaB